MSKYNIKVVEISIAILSISYLKLYPFLVSKMCDFWACSTSHTALGGFPKVADPLVIAEA